MWLWSKMEKISWRDMKRNEEVLQMVPGKEGCDLEKEEKLDWPYYSEVKVF